MKIGIIGGGVVGRATARTYLEFVEEVRVYDVLKERSTHPIHKVFEADLIFVCLPTPQRKESLECDLEEIEWFFENVSRNFNFDEDFPIRDKNYVLRSTVPIGTTRRLAARYGLPNLVHSPEFLTARCAETDAMIPARNIIGHTYADTEEYASEGVQRLVGLYERRFPGVPIHVMTSDESEAVKLFVNGFFATKVAYFNEVRCLADELGLDWERVLAGVLADGRITANHTRVPGPDGKRGFGGACLEKDMAMLVHSLKDTGFVTGAALARNKWDRESCSPPQRR